MKCNHWGSLHNLLSWPQANIRTVMTVVKSIVFDEVRIILVHFSLVHV